MDKSAVMQSVVPDKNNLAAAKVTLSPETLAELEGMATAKSWRITKLSVNPRSPAWLHQ